MFCLFPLERRHLRRFCMLWPTAEEDRNCPAMSKHQPQRKYPQRGSPTVKINVFIPGPC